MRRKRSITARKLCDKLPNLVRASVSMFELRCVWVEDCGAVRLTDVVLTRSVVVWEAGGRSLYFRDPDGHLLELATPGVWSQDW